MTLCTSGMPTARAEALWQGGLDDNGQQPLVWVSDGDRNPCRHCLSYIPAGEKMLVLAYRPFETLSPYSEVGPVFIHAERCKAPAPQQGLGILDADKRFAVRIYDEDEVMIYPLAERVDGTEIQDKLERLLSEPGSAFAHVRSGQHGCFRMRVDRA